MAKHLPDLSNNSFKDEVNPEQHDDYTDSRKAIYDLGQNKAGKYLDPKPYCGM
ncbi:hypothetical protein BGZ95_006185 [Linnemannia exigua]|uniref:Uncharacterized protein n=1 Tax=Linnemannia exigua TaxID=604196 RepID=A0AAD4H7E4_9FUNG|nr:hypothetical protein BGZ95_006185 [Linnemannia exigua]